jgi:putative addiction module killer protein
MEIREYLTPRGISPFEKWYKKLDRSLQTKIDARLSRIKIMGSLGNTKGLGSGLYELKFSMPSGPRIYYAKEGDKLILLLIGGKKSSQSKDIEKAREYLKDYKERRRDHGQ